MIIVNMQNQPGSTGSSLVKKNLGTVFSKAQPSASTQNVGLAPHIVFGLPPGWKREECTKQSGLGTGKSEIYYIRLVRCFAMVLTLDSPDGQKVRSKNEMRPILDDKHDLSLFDWRSGRFVAPLKSRKAEDNPDSASPKISRIDSVNCSLQRRITYPESLTPVIIRTHPECKQNDSKNSTSTDAPRQLFWEKRLAGCHAVNADTGEIYKPINLPKGIQSAGVPGYDSTEVVYSLVDSLASKTSCVVGQEQQTGTIEKNPCVAINHLQPMIKAYYVTDEDIRMQEARVKELRKKLEIARKKLNPRHPTEREG